MDIKILSRVIIILWRGMINLKKEIKIKGMVRTIVLIVYNRMDKIPLIWGGKNASIIVFNLV